MIRWVAHWKRLWRGTNPDAAESNIEAEPVSWEQWRKNLRAEAEDEQRRNAAIDKAFDRVHSTPLTRKLRGLK